MSSILLVSGDRLEFLGSEERGAGFGPQPPFSFSLTLRGSGETVSFSQEPATVGEGEAGEAITIEELGAELPDWEDENLLSFVLQGYFSVLSRRLPEGMRTSIHRLYFPFWMGPRERRLLRRAAQHVEISLLEGLERGLAPVLTRVWQGEDPPSSGGWIVADRCGADLDLYGISDRLSETGREIELVGYRRCPQISSAYYATRRSEAAEVVEAALATLPSSWRLLATDNQATELLSERAAKAGSEIRSFADHVAALEAHGLSPGPMLVTLSRHWRYWLDYGDDRLEPLDEGGGQYPHRVECLLSIPDPPPDHIRLGLRMGFHPTRLETQEICQVRISRPDLHYAPGFLLVLLRLRGHGSGDLEIDVIQRGKSVHRVSAPFFAY
jgi:hypothetical protein